MIFYNADRLCLFLDLSILGLFLTKYFSENRKYILAVIAKKYKKIFSGAFFEFRHKSRDLASSRIGILASFMRKQEFVFGKSLCCGRRHTFHDQHIGNHKAKMLVT